MLLCFAQEFSWEDRDRVLRMMFASITCNRRQQTRPPQPPPPQHHHQQQRHELPATVSYESDDDDEVDYPGPLRGLASMARPAELV